MAYLVSESGSMPGRRLKLDDQELVIGSSSQCGLKLFGLGIAERHAMIEQRGDGRFALVDLGRHDDVLVDGEHRQINALREGCRIEIGGHRFVFHAGALPQAGGEQGAKPGEGRDQRSSAIFDVMSEYEQNKKAEDAKPRIWYSTWPFKLAATLIVLAGLGYGGTKLVPHATDAEKLRDQLAVANWQEIAGRIIDDMQAHPDKYKNIEPSGDPEKLLKSLGINPDEAKNFVLGRVFGGGGGGGSRKSASGADNNKGGAGGGMMDAGGGGNVSMTVKNNPVAKAGGGGGPEPSSRGGGATGVRAKEGGTATMNFENTQEGDQSKDVAQSTKLGEKTGPAKGNLSKAMPTFEGGGDLQVNEKNKGTATSDPNEEEDLEDQDGDVEQALAGVEKEATRKPKRRAGHPIPGGGATAEDDGPVRCEWSPAEDLAAAPDPRVALASTGEFVFQWRDGDRVRAVRRLHGRATGSEDSFSPPVHPDRAYDRVEGVGEVSVWVADDAIWVQRSDETGQPLGGPIAVRRSPFAEDSAVAMDENGGFAVAWVDRKKAGDPPTVRVRRFDPTGLPVGPSIPMSGEASEVQGAPDVAVRADGAFAVVWTAGHAAMSDLAVTAQFFSPDLDPVCPL